MTSLDNAILGTAELFAERSHERPLFHEDLVSRLRRLALGIAYALAPKRISLLPRLLLLSIAHILKPEAERQRLPEHPTYYGNRGLVGISDDLSPQALIANYSRGYFPVCHVGPMKWWCPEERAVIDPAETHVSKNLRRMLRQHRFSVTFDQDFARVIEACAAPRPGKVPLTWITPRVMQAFYDAHEAGHAHSVEVWDQDGTLAGGLYGLAVGKAFFGESQFSTVEHMSKVALITLHRHLREWGYHLRDGKWMTPHLATFGFRSIPRQTFLTQLASAQREPGRIGKWSADPSLDLADWSSTAPSTGHTPRTILNGRLNVRSHD